MADNTFTYIDPKALYAESLDSFETHWDDYATIWDNTANLFNHSVLLPDHREQSPILISYLLVNQKWSKTLPILFLYGKEGSGKSQVIKLAAQLHDSTILGSDSTFASVRNELTRMKWLDLDEDKEVHRDGALLLFDNVYPSTFLNDEKLYSMILRSYEAENDTVLIAGPMGENIKFKTFTSKIISSVQPFGATHALRELNRRMIVIRTKALRDMVAGEVTDDISDNMLDLDSINFEGLNWKYVQFWNDASVCMNYVKQRQLLTRSNGVAQKYLRSLLSEERRKIVVDLIVTSVVTGGFTSLEASIEAFAEYYKIHDERSSTEMPASIDSFKEFVEQYVVLAGSGSKVIPADMVKKHCEHLNDTWKAEQRIGQKEVSQIMATLGWTLDNARGGWVPTIQ